MVAPYPFTTTDTHTRVVRVSRKSEAVRLGRWWDPRKRPVKRVGAQKPAVGRGSFEHAKCQLYAVTCFSPLRVRRKSQNHGDVPAVFP